MKRKYQLVKSIIIFATACGLALLYFFCDARLYGIFPKCPFHSLTGFYCPGCGSQRATSALLHGEIFKAIQYNVLFVASLPFVVYSGTVNLLNIFRKNPFIQNIFYSPLFVKTVLFLVVLFGVLRNIPVYPFSTFAPK